MWEGLQQHSTLLTLMSMVSFSTHRQLQVQTVVSVSMPHNSLCVPSLYPSVDGQKSAHAYKVLSTRREQGKMLQYTLPHSVKSSLPEVQSLNP